jgi:hypothetical protein
MKIEAERLLTSLYCPPVKFEHGPCSYAKVGACVDHAHLHLVPMQGDLSAELNSFFPCQRMTNWSDLSARYDSGHPYLFYEDAAGRASAYDISLIPSQFARMLVARKLGTAEKYDWRKYPGEDELRVFIRDLGHLKSRREYHELIA